MLLFHRCLHSLVREGRDIPRQTLSSRVAAYHGWSVQKRVNDMLSVILVRAHLISASVSAVRVLASLSEFDLLLLMMLKHLELFVSQRLRFFAGNGLL